MIKYLIFILLFIPLVSANITIEYPNQILIGSEAEILLNFTETPINLTINYSTSGIKTKSITQLNDNYYKIIIYPIIYL